MNVTDLPAWYADQHDYGLRRSSLEQLQIATRLLADWHGSPLTLADLSDSLLTAYVDHLRETRSPAYARSQRGNLLCMIRAACEAGLCEYEPRRVRRVRLPRRNPTAWSPGEVLTLVCLARNLPGRFNGTAIGRAANLEALLLAAWDTGLRLGDLVALRASEIRPDGVLCHLQSKTQVEQLCQLDGDTLEAVARTMADERREKIWPLHKRTYQDWIGRLCRQAGLRGSAKWIRRGVATWCENAREGDGSRVLGHAGRETLRYYLDRTLGRRPVHPAPLKDAAG